MIINQKELNRLDKRATELKEKIRLLCEEFPEFAILGIFEPEHQAFIEIAGNLCPLCASENLLTVIHDKRLQHHKKVFPESNSVN